ncbi:MAG: hypothetical protein RTV31_11750 [Candidatus Thorarchaeota archaeon]
MRILVVGSCGKKKLNQSTVSPTCKDLASIDDIKTWREKSSYPTTRVRDLYAGNQNRELVKGVDLLRQIEKTEVKLSIISAGFGLVEEKDTLPSYDCSFSRMGNSQIKERAQWLRIPLNFKKLLTSGFDLVYLALGKKYLLTLGEEWKTKSNTTVVGFNRSLSEEKMLCIPSAHKIVSAFSRSGHKIHGITGFKGDLLRILADYALKQDNPYRELLAWTHPVYLRDLVMKLGNLEIWY